jgi:LPS sulfotransferase NodH
MDYSSDLTFAGYLRIARAESTTANGVSGIKVHYYQFADLPRRMQALPGWHEMSSAQVLTAMFPGAKYVWLKRRDKARQAISLYLASQTEQWWSINGHDAEVETSDTEDLEFDPIAIAKFENRLAINDRKWAEFFETNEITPLVIEYEDFAADYAGTISTVLDWLGLPGAPCASFPAPRLRRQSNARNDDWAARYAAFKEAHRCSLPELAACAAESASFKPARKPLDVVHNVWKQWVAQARLDGHTDDAIVGVLIANGYSRGVAETEVRKAASDPYILGCARSQRRLKKAASLLNTKGELRHLDSHAHVVERRRQLSADEFRDAYYATNRPVIIVDAIADWNALAAWTPDYLKGIAGESVVEVMTGRDADPRYEIKADRHRTEMRFADYIDMVCSGKATNDYYMTANNKFFQRPQTVPLLNDLTPLLQYLKPDVHGGRCFLWFGPAGTITPLHHDTSNILMAQVVGRKRYRLIPPEHWQYVYNSSGVFSDVDCENPDFTRYPKFRHATITEVVLSPGEMLFMPVGWWHHTRALEVAMTVTFTSFAYPNHFSWE